MHGAQTCVCTHVERATVWVKRLCQFNGQHEGLASSQHQLLRGNLTCVVFNIVGFGLEVHVHQAWTTTRYEQTVPVETSTDVNISYRWWENAGFNSAIFPKL